MFVTISNNFFFMVALSSQKVSVIRQLQREILSPQGGTARGERRSVHIGLGAIEAAFPQYSFPTAAVHEFISGDKTTAAATSGFMCGLLQQLAAGEPGSACIWVSTQHTIYPPSLALFGIAPERVVFVNVRTDHDALWTVEEALKCEGLAVVIGEVRELDFSASRRLQLAVERSHVTGFIHRQSPRTEGTNACVARWRIAPLSSAPVDSLPGMGHPRWNVRLQKIRNGRPGAWHLEWTGKEFRHVPLFTPSLAESAPLSYPKVA